MKNTIKTLKYEDLIWDFDNSEPYYTLKTGKAKYPRTERVDPYPCYSHDENLITELNKEFEEKVQIDYPIFIFLLSHEGLARTNGFAFTAPIYCGQKPEPFEGVVVLHGKRIPLHPAMSRYLLFHEGSHQIDYYICNKLQLGDNGLDEEYSKFRNIELIKAYGGPNWSKNIGEIIANDLRICLFDSEEEFWPHPFEHPFDFGKEKIKDWWVNKINEANQVKSTNKEKE